MSEHPLGDPLSGREDFGCNCYSAGESIYVECIMPSAYKHMLGFFQLVNDVPGYEEMEFRRPEVRKDAVWVKSAEPERNQNGDSIDVGIEAEENGYEPGPYENGGEMDEID